MGILSEHFGKRLSQLMKETGISRGDIAEKLGVTPQAVSKWTGGSSLPHEDHWIKLGEIFQKPLVWFVSGEMTQTPASPLDALKVLNAHFGLKVQPERGELGNRQGEILASLVVLVAKLPEGKRQAALDAIERDYGKEMAERIRGIVK